MRLLCETVVSEILPAIRALVTRELLQTYGFSQLEASKKLGVTQPAISQYKRELRGSQTKELESNRKAVELIKNLSDGIAKEKIDQVEFHRKVCQICEIVRNIKIDCPFEVV